MIDDAFMVWYSLEDSAITATRTQFRRWMIELDLPGGSTSKHSTLTTFTRICRSTVIEYISDAGLPRMITSIPGKKAKEFTAFNVVRDDGVKVGEIKYFPPRRVEKGVIGGTDRVMDKTRRNMDPADEAAAKAWIKTARDAYSTDSVMVTWPLVRRTVQVGLERVCIPVIRRRSMVFCYGDDLPVVMATKELVRRTFPDPAFEVLKIAPDADPSILALSADAWMLGRATDLSAAMEAWTRSRSNAKKSRREALAGWGQAYRVIADRADQHEGRLGASLPQTQQALVKASQMMTALRSSSSLPSVTSG